MHDLSADDADLLRALANRLIPASAEYGVPGAGDARIFADIVSEMHGRTAALGGLLDVLRRVGLQGVLEAPLGDLLAQAQPASGGSFFAFAAALISAYYRDDRVMASLDMEPRPPFPKGYAVEEGDLSLLDPVRARGPIWRPIG